MPESMTLYPGPSIPRHPFLESLDCGEEFSIFHWIEVCKLVDEADLPEADGALPAEFERALEETLLRESLLEVEPSTAYEHLASHVV